MAYTQKHRSFAWGLIEFDELEISTPSYAAATDYVTMGPSAVVGAGIGVRRVTLHFDRSLATPADDDCNMHFDFINITGGDPDDTWITADFTALEGHLNTWWTAVKAKTCGVCRLYRYSWHRVGPGVTKPNPAVRILDLTTPSVGTGATSIPPQASCSITSETGLRKHWGRTYLPLGVTVNGAGRLSGTDTDLINTATVSMFQAAMAADFAPVVVSLSANQAFGVEAVRTDDTIDIVRRRRWKHRTYLKRVAL